MLLLPFCDFDASDCTLISIIAAQRVPEDISRRSPANKVLSTYELVAKIVVHLKPREILVNKRVSPIWRNVVETSPPEASHVGQEISQLFSHDKIPSHWQENDGEITGNDDEELWSLYPYSLPDIPGTLRMTIHQYNSAVLQLQNTRSMGKTHDCKPCSVFDEFQHGDALQAMNVNLDHVTLSQAVENNYSILDMQLASPPISDIRVYYAERGCPDIIAGGDKGVDVHFATGITVHHLLEISEYQEDTVGEPNLTVRFFWVPEGHFTSSATQKAVEMAGPQGLTCLAKMQAYTNEDKAALQEQVYEEMAEMQELVDANRFDMQAILDAEKHLIDEGQEADFDVEAAQIAIYANNKEDQDELDGKFEQMRLDHNAHEAILQGIVDREVERMLAGFPLEQEQQSSQDVVIEEVDAALENEQVDDSAVEHEGSGVY
ncbi:hypothetical protein TI39_contig4202g00021 [Zymoseptoria brevis]|uniref:F-box domain-containing protein n=1 Tax=Zymoseptoria brevis TaxID=1047168 RepID=A0A0F4GAA7_9PEZI|nr:hypothetical protein TI39_contig4202g00021 [Zymoseptoria brevis]